MNTDGQRAILCRKVDITWEDNAIWLRLDCGILVNDYDVMTLQKQWRSTC
jgi:hypothetical protein